MSLSSILPERKYQTMLAITWVYLGLLSLFCVWSYRYPTLDQNVVFVKTNDVMARYKGAIQARETFQRESAGWAEEAKELDSKLQELIKGGKLSDPKVKERARQFRSRIEALREKGAKRDQELTAPMVAEVNAGIKKFATRHGYKLVVGTQNGGVVLHGDDSVDVTEALIAELNR